MTLKQIEYFLSCATLLNFRKAAQLHYISPPTLTRQIRALESELQIALFEHGANRVSLTDAGQTFFDTAYKMLNVYRQFYDQLNMSGMRSERQGNPFLIGSYAFDGMYGALVDAILSLPDFFLNRPIQIDFMESGAMIPSVLRGEIQIGIDSEAHIRKHGDLFEMRLLKTVPFHVAVGNQHPLCPQKSVAPEALYPFFSTDHVHPAKGQAFGNKLTFPIDSTEALRKIGELTIEALPALFPVLNNSAMGSETIAILPQTLRAGNIKQLHFVEITGGCCSTNYMLFWLKDNPNPDIRRFIDSI